MNSVPVSPPITEYLYQKATRAGVPLSGTFELTPVCNMDCKMCYVRLSKEQQQAQGALKSAQQWIELGQKAKEAGLLYLLLTGGEPFTHPQFRQIVEGLHQLGLLISINTNGTMIREEAVQWLKKYPPLRVNVSLYGCSDETYERLCGNPNGFTQTDKAIRLLRQAGISVKLNCSLTPDNAQDLPAMVQYAKEQNLILQVATYMFPPVRKDEKMTGQNFRFSPEDAAYYEAYTQYLQRGEKALDAECPIIPDPDDHCANPGDGVRCRAGRCSFWVTWQGTLLACGMFPVADRDNVFEADFVSAWENLKASIAAIRLPAPCSGCEAKDSCHACAAMVYGESGCFDAVPRYRCQMMQAYPQQRLRVKEEIR